MKTNPAKYTLECELFGSLKRKNKESKFSLKVNKGTTYIQLLTNHLKFSATHLRHFTVISNSRSVENFSEKIPNKARIKVLMTIGGG